MSWNERLIVTRNVETILGWPSDTFSVDFRAAADTGKGQDLRNFPHTVLVFIPGNPGLVEWYLPMFVQLVERLGPGFAARGCSLAGHSTKSDSAVNVEQWKDSPDRDISVPWTVDGQVYHKCAYMDTIVHEFNALKKQWGLPDSAESPRFIFVSHSIGVHFTQRLCILRPSILEQTRLLINLMPFTRMKAPRPEQRLLDFVAANPEQTIRVHQGLMQILKRMPFQWVDLLMQGAMKDKDGRKVAVELVRQPAFARNFFSLGLEEIRDVPEEFDTSAMRLIGRHCPAALLFAGNDHWSPAFHMDDLRDLQAKGTIPSNISITYMPQLRHDYVTDPKQVAAVVEFCMDNIETTLKNSSLSRSRL